MSSSLFLSSWRFAYCVVRIEFSSLVGLFCFRYFTWTVGAFVLSHQHCLVCARSCHCSVSEFWILAGCVWTLLVCFSLNLSLSCFFLSTALLCHVYKLNRVYKFLIFGSFSFAFYTNFFFFVFRCYLYSNDFLFTMPCVLIHTAHTKIFLLIEKRTHLHAHNTALTRTTIKLSNIKFFVGVVDATCLFIGLNYFFVVFVW